MPAGAVASWISAPPEHACHRTHKPIRSCCLPLTMDMYHGIDLVNDCTWRTTMRWLVPFSTWCGPSEHRALSLLAFSMSVLGTLCSIQHQSQSAFAARTNLWAVTLVNPLNTYMSCCCYHDFYLLTIIISLLSVPGGRANQPAVPCPSLTVHACSVRPGNTSLCLFTYVYYSNHCSCCCGLHLLTILIALLSAIDTVPGVPGGRTNQPTVLCPSLTDHARSVRPGKNSVWIHIYILM